MVSIANNTKNIGVTINGIKTLITLFTLTIVVLFSPTSHSEDSITKADIYELVQGNKRLAFDLYDELKEQKGNLLFSPYSISVLHAMIYAGARGNTEKQISDVFHFTLDPKKLHPAFHSVQLELKSAHKKRGVELKDLSAIFVQRGYKVFKEYLDTLGNNYKPVLFYANFSRERSKVRDKINEWVARHTRLRIEDLVKDDDLSTMTRMFLVNAIYFKGNWQYPFDKSATKKMRFWQARNKAIYVSMMFQEASLISTQSSFFLLSILLYPCNT